MTTEQELKAIFNLPKDTIATPTTMAVEYESVIYRLKKKEEYITKLYSKYLDEIKDESEGHTVTKYTRITELGFSDKAIATLKKLGITTLADFENVTRAELEQNKAIGDDNTRRIAKIIEPIGIAFSNIPDIAVNADTFELNDDAFNKAILNEERKENANKKENENENSEISEKENEEYVLNGNIGPIEDTVILGEDATEPCDNEDVISLSDFAPIFDVAPLPGDDNVDLESNVENTRVEEANDDVNVKEKKYKKSKKEENNDSEASETKEDVHNEEFIGAEEDVDVMDDIEDDNLAF